MSIEATPDPTPNPTADSPPDAAPDPEAPYGRKADGTPKRKPGRPPKGESATEGAGAPSGVLAAPPAEEKPKPARSPKPKEPTPLERVAETLESSGNEDSWLSAAADAARCERARRFGHYWIEPVRFALNTGEEVARAAIHRDIVTKHGADNADRIVNAIPRLREVRMRYGEKETTCEQVQAESLAFVCGYFVPIVPDHPLIQAGLGFTASIAAYKSAIEIAIERALAKG